MGPGRTGVKGVIRDRNEAAARERLRKTAELAELASRMEHANLGGLTFLEGGGSGDGSDIYARSAYLGLSPQWRRIETCGWWYIYMIL